MGISTKTCKKCGTELLPGADFCDHCGNAATLKGIYIKNRKVLPIISFILPIVFFMCIGWSLFIGYGSSYYMHDGDKAFWLEDYKGAINYYNRSLEIDPGNKEAQYKKGLSLFWLADNARRHGKENEAMNYGNKSIESLLRASNLESIDNNLNVFLYLKLSDVYNFLGNNTEAQKWRNRYK